MNGLRLTLLALCLGTIPAVAEETGALVIDVVGEVSPAVDAFEDVAPGTVLALGAGAELTISHYRACEEVTLAGGRVTVGMDGLELDGTETLAREAVDCPSNVALAVSDTASATVIVRNFEELPRVPISPSIVLIGENAGKFNSMTLRRENQVITSLDIVNRQVQWPAEGLYLSNRTKYELVLAGDEGEFAAEVVADRRTDARVVLRP